jgi:AraC family transcriptional regulator, transcriptional activator of pobA
MKKKLPVYRIGDFGDNRKHPGFYANYLQPHVARHTFTHLPHKHDFFLVMLITGGKGWHEVDFIKYKVKAGSVFLMQPGQMHYWKLSEDIKGYVLFHNKVFYEEGYAFHRLRDFPFYKSFQSDPGLFLQAKQRAKPVALFQEIIEEYGGTRPLQLQKVQALLQLLYIELSRACSPAGKTGKKPYLDQLQAFESLIEINFRQMKYAGEYAKMLHISEKHLNRIVKDSIGKTSTQLIADRIILEAKRLLIQGKLNVTEVGYELGYSDRSYFVRFFKKQSGETPLSFVRRYANNIS